MICIETNKNITAEVDLLDLVIKLVHTSDDINKKKGSGSSSGSSFDSSAKTS